MDTLIKTRVCWSCEGRLVDNEQRCPYCGADQLLFADIPKELPSSPFKLVKAQDEAPIPIPLYKPAAETVLKDSLQEQMAAIKKIVPALEPKEEPSPTFEPVVVTEVEEKPITKHDVQRAYVASLIAALGGSTFFLFGLALYLFSTEGMLTVKWNSNFWPAYLLSSLPLLFISWTLMKKFDRD